MSLDALRERVKGLVPQARADLSRMVALASVYDPQAPISPGAMREER